MANVKNIALGIALKYIKKLIESGITVKKAYLYGSYARESATKDSDIDIAIISPDFTGDRFHDAIFLKRMRTNIDLRIEPLPIKTDDFVKKDPLVSEILSYAIPITVYTHKSYYKSDKIKKRSL